MKTKLIAMMLLAGGSMFAGTRFSFGVNLGAPVYAAPPVVAYQPPYPGPGYVWVDGYYDAYGNFIPGYWALPPYTGAYWVAPRFDGGRFVAGFWAGGRGFDRDDHRFRESREHERNQHDRGSDHRGDFGRGFRR